MALSDLAVYSEYAYAAMTEVLSQQIALFNGATRGGIQLSLAANQGDFNDIAFFKKISGLVRRRNAYGSGAVGSKKLEHLIDTMVKVAAGTPPVEIDPGQFRWIQQDPKLAGAILGQQLAGDALADMLNTSLGIAVAALGTKAANTLDKTAATGNDGLMNFANLGAGAAKFGDRSDAIRAWVMHSTPFFQMYGQNLANSANLFNYSTVNVIQDPMGKLFVLTDSANLFTDAAADYYNTLGLVDGAVLCQQNNDFDANEESKNGDENIQRTYQAEWSYNVGLKGFSWDKTAGGKSPADAALFTGTNWDQYATSHKDTAGVLLKTLATALPEA
jgi:hypothetical protein